MTQQRKNTRKDVICRALKMPPVVATQHLSIRPFCSLLFCSISIQTLGQTQTKRRGFPHVATWWSNRSREPLLMYSVTMQKNSGSLQMPKIWMMWLNLALWSTSASFSRQFLSLKYRRFVNDLNWGTKTSVSQCSFCNLATGAI